MSLPDVVSREERVAARRRLLAREKELTRQRDALSADRRRLPMVRIEKEYAFEGSGGPAGLRDMFDGSRQLIIYHAMFDPAGDSACPGCTALLDETSPGLRAHLEARDTAFAVVSRAPQARLAAYAAARGWTFPWYSSYGSDFNYDFHVTLDAAVAPVEYNFKTQSELALDDPSWLEAGSSEAPGFSCFLLAADGDLGDGGTGDGGTGDEGTGTGAAGTGGTDGEAVFHTYSTYGRGTEAAGSTYSLLDLTALGRQEDWEEPKGRVAQPGRADPSFS
jgi:predicted dithiol-disulfide oxidoreductase (DUF899 family)